MPDFTFQFVLIRSELTASSCHTGGQVGTLGNYSIVDRNSEGGPGKDNEVLKMYDPAQRTASKRYKCSMLNHKAQVTAHLCN